MLKVGDRIRMLGPCEDYTFVTGEILIFARPSSPGFIALNEALEEVYVGSQDKYELVNNNKSIPEQSNKGTKFDSEKPPLSIIPTDALVGMANAFNYGAKKYSRNNFRNGIEYTRLVDACMRHLSSWVEGESVDPESTLSHVDHAMASLAMLKFMEVNKPEMDDRWKNPETQKVDGSKKSQALYEEAKKIQERGR
jgi:Domain of unknown function (DUF5664)